MLINSSSIVVSKDVLVGMTLAPGCLNINKIISKETVNNVHIINSPKTVDSIREVKLDDELIKNLEILKKYYQNMISFEDNWFIFGGLNPLSHLQ